MPAPILPRIAEILGPGLDSLAAKRPRAFAFANLGQGRWTDIFAGWGGQCALLLRRLGDEVASARLKLATKDSLTDLCASEFGASRSNAATQAIGKVTLTRPTALTGGAIPAGFRFRRDAFSATFPPIASAVYEATQDTPFPYGVLSIPVNARAQRPGAFANAPVIDGANDAFVTLQIADAPFDPGIRATAYEFAGGSDGENDDDLRRQASAYVTGQYAPTLGSIIAGTLQGTGVHRYAAFDVAQVLSGGRLLPAAFTGLVIADASWSASALWEAQVAQNIADSFLGHGCTLMVSGVTNKLVRVECTVSLVDAKALTDTSGITTAIQAALKAYFDDRPDWYTFKASAIRGVIGQADPRILSCTAAAVRTVSNNASIADPPVPVATPAGFALTHYYLAQNAVIATYLAPT